MNLGYNRDAPYLYRGIIEDNIDPEGLGRCKVRVPSIHGELTYPIDILPWARPLVLSPVKSNRGSVELPDKGDIVWVLFEGGDRNFPIYFGGTYAKGELDVSNDRVDFYIEGQDAVKYDRKSREYDIQIGTTHIEASPNRVHVLVGDSSITVTPNRIDIVGDTYIRGKLHVTDIIKSDADVYAQSVSLYNHVHDGVSRGLNETNEPVK